MEIKGPAGMSLFSVWVDAGAGGTGLGWKGGGKLFDSLTGNTGILILFQGIVYICTTPWLFALDSICFFLICKRKENLCSWKRYTDAVLFNADSMKINKI